MSLGLSITNTAHSFATSSRLFLNQSLFSTNEQTPSIHLNTPRKRSNLARTATASGNKANCNTTRYSYRACPICSQRLLVRINGSFVYKWISTHFSTHHHEWMHVVVNLHEV